MKRTILIACALVAALAVPATASAARTITTAPVKVAGGYQVSLMATDGDEDRLIITMQHGTWADGQSDVLQFTRGVRVTIKGASVSVKGTLGSRGSVDLRLRGARINPKAKLPKGCTGKRATTLTGRLEGKLRLKLPNGKFVTIRSFPGATMIQSGSDLKCTSPGVGDGGDGGDGGSGDGEPRLMLNTMADGVNVTFIAEKRSLMLTRSSQDQRDGRATVSAFTTVTASGSNLLTVSGGGARAAVRSAGRFTGSGEFTATVSSGSYATGPLTGSLQVRLQGASTVAIAGDDAILLNGDKG